MHPLTAMDYLSTIPNLIFARGNALAITSAWLYEAGEGDTSNHALIITLMNIKTSQFTTKQQVHKENRDRFQVQIAKNIECEYRTQALMQLMATSIIDLIQTTIDQTTTMSKP